MFNPCLLLFSKVKEWKVKVKSVKILEVDALKGKCLLKLNKLKLVKNY